MTLTKSHVVAEASRLQIGLAGGDSDARLIEHDPHTELTVLKVSGRRCGCDSRRMSEGIDALHPALDEEQLGKSAAIRGSRHKRLREFAVTPLAIPAR